MKLNPPILGLTINAFTASTGLTVPFEMNPSVTSQQVKGFQVLITNIVNDGNKTSASITLTDDQKVKEALDTGVVTFELSNEVLSILNVGAAGHIQLAYIDTNNEIGYYSTAAVAKYTYTPILGLDILSNGKHFTGIYTSQDVNESVYKYRFVIRTNSGTVLDDSGEQIHNSSLDSVNSTITCKDTFATNKMYEPNMDYTVTYYAETLNGLKVSWTKPFRSNYAIDSLLNASIIIDYDRENGCVNLSMDIKNNLNLWIEQQNIKGTYQLLRADNKDNYTTWTPIHVYRIYNGEIPYTHKDCTVEQGVSYKYAYQQFNKYGVYSKIFAITEPITIDFEYMYLGDKNRQIKLAYNSKVSSFKSVILESKVDTIGGKYPFYFRNGNVNYKEFPISGLISYHLDEGEFFISRDKLGLQKNLNQRKLTNENNNIELHIPTTNQVGYNFTAERKFRLELLDWLNNGEEKMFRSAQEGNYIVRLSGVSLTPNDTLSRMIYDFNATAHECRDWDINKMVAAGGLVDTTELDGKIYQSGTDSISNEKEIQLPTGAVFETIKIENAFPETTLEFYNNGEYTGTCYKIGTSGYMEATSPPAADKIKLQTAYNDGIINYTYSTAIDIIGTNFDNITGVYFNTAIGDKSDLNNEDTNIHEIYVAIVEGSGAATVDGQPIEINGKTKFENIKSLEIDDSMTVTMYYSYYYVTLKDIDVNNIISSDNNNLIAQAGVKI